MFNLKILKLLSVAGAGLLMAACASNYDIGKVAALPSTGDAFAQALHKHYNERAEFEFGEGDWASVNYFNTHAVTAAGGVAPGLQSLSERILKVDVDDIGAAHKRLSGALASHAPQTSPDACALSQVWLEHWMEQSAEGHQPDDIATARSAYQQAIPGCISGPAPMATAPSYIVYFDFNSAKLSAHANAVVSVVALYVKGHGGKSVSLMGHTDSAGDGAYNNRLSVMRVQAVKAALRAAGVSAIKSTAGYGEKRPSVMTDDGVKNAENRRVEITIMN